MANSFEDELKQGALCELTDHDLAAELGRRGWVTTKDDPHAERHIDIEPFKKGRIRIAIASDTHLGSKYQQLTHWRHFARDVAPAWKPDIAFHCGDVVDGTHKMHRGMEYEQFVLGAEGQAAYAIENWPEVVGIRQKPVLQYVVGGNHDGSFFKDSGADILTTIARERSDIEVLGAPAATFHVENLQIYLLHPSGGPAYARSYKPQKLIEQFDPSAKPHVHICGHWHIPVHVPAYDGVEAFTLPSFQAQTPYLKTKGLFSVIGGLLLDIEYDGHGITSLRTHWQIYRRAIPHDY